DTVFPVRLRGDHPDSFAKEKNVNTYFGNGLSTDGLFPHWFLLQFLMKRGHCLSQNFGEMQILLA
ncbi:MAG: hypothetical protein P8J33_03425, partial [Pirellulaceae bacterium]|nr:hypothetical protein [Pirellulaceae bacterium]